MKEVEHPAAEEPNISIRSWWRTEIWLLWDDTVALCLLTDVNRQLFADMLAKPTYQSDNMSGLFIYLTKVWLIHLYSYSLDEIEDVNLVLLLHIVHYVEAASFLPSSLSLSLFLSFSSVSLCLWPLTCALTTNQKLSLPDAARPFSLPLWWLCVFKNFAAALRWFTFSTNKDFPCAWGKPSLPSLCRVQLCLSHVYTAPLAPSPALHITCVL